MFYMKEKTKIFMLGDIILFCSFIHLEVSLTTGLKPLPKRALHIVRFRASSFIRAYPLLHPVAFYVFFLVFLSPPFIFPSITRCRRQFLRKMWPIQVAFRLLTKVGTLIVETIYLQLIQNRYMFRGFTVLQCSHQHCVQPVASDVEVVGYL